MREPEVRRRGSAYVYRWPAPEPVEIEIDQVRQKTDDWVGWITVRYHSAGVTPHLAEATHNLGAMQARTQLARHLSTRVRDIDWPAYLEMACVLTVRAEREGEPFDEVGDLPERDRPFWLIEPLVRVGLPTIIYGDGGSGKSTTALMLAGTVLSGLAIAGFTPCWQAPVLYLDWETDKEEIDDTMKALRSGHGIDIPNIYYRREVWPLAQTARQVKRFIDEKGVVLTVVDSIGAACGAEPESAEVTLRFFQAVRSLGTAALCVDHISKAGANGKPFGSVYKHNAARLTFEMRRHQLPEEDVMHIGLYHTKANKGRMQRPFGLRVTFGEGSIRFDREDIPASATELVAGLSASERLIAAMREARESLTVTDLCALTGLADAVVKARLSDLIRRGRVTRLSFQPVGTERPASRYALRSAHSDEVAG